MGPNQLLVFLVDIADILIMSLLTNVDRGDAVFDHVNKACGDVAALAFGLEDYAAAMGRTRIRAEHAEEIRKIRHRQPEIGGGIVVGPRIPELLAVPSTDIEARCHFRDLRSEERRGG